MSNDTATSTSAVSMVVGKRVFLDIDEAM